MTRFHGALLLVLVVVTGAIVLLPVIDGIVQRRAAKRQPPTTKQPRPGITDARNCPATDNACRRECAGRCWHQE